MRTLVSLCALTTACVAPPVGPLKTDVSQVSHIRVSQNDQAQVDILFMIDNSPSMDAMQAELVAKFPQFLQAFDAIAHPIDGSEPQYADLHIGVVTSDYGAGDVNGNGCEASPGGQKGLLQAKGAAAEATCQAPMGAAYIEYAFGASGDTCNLPGGCTPDNLGAVFTCMASVGSAGCGFEHQLESVYAALSSTANAGFVRDPALLAVVFVTNEDDGSAPPGTSIFDPNPMLDGDNGAYTTYRQTHFGVACGTPPALTPEGASMGPLAGCEPAPNTMTSMLGQEYDVSRYTTLFNTPGVKADPMNDIILVGIDAPVTPLQTILAIPGTGVGKTPSPAYETCDALGSQCIVALQHSCQNGPAPAFFGDPPVRLNAVIQTQPLNTLADICGADPTQPPDYSQALQKVASLITTNLKPGCVPAEVADLDDPDCVVADVTLETDGTKSQASIPSCHVANGTFPCWNAVITPKCAPPASPQSLSIQIDRNGTMAPPNTSLSVGCSTKACPAGDPDC